MKSLIAKGCPHAYSDALLVHSEGGVLFREEVKQLRRTTETLPARTYENHSTDLLKPSVMRQAGKRHKDTTGEQERNVHSSLSCFSTLKFPWQ